MFTLFKYARLALEPESWRNAANDLRLVPALMADPRVPVQAKAFPALATVYLFSPLDLVPGWVPVLGQLDDLAVMLLAIRQFKALVPPDVLAEYEQRLGINRAPRRAAAQTVVWEV
jgi:uncharacterized membrane protein YkvA (DUF1232 family)